MSGVLVGKVAPDFTAAAVLADNRIDGSFCLSEFIKNKIGVLVFYPLDFTFVCPTELIALSNRIEDFKARGAEVIGISVDSQFTHLAFKMTPVEKGGIGAINFPLVSDLNKNIASSYDVLHNGSVALRGTFIIDKNFIVRHQLINDLPLGRSMDESLRIIDAIKHHETHGEVCPANWSKGKQAMKADSEGVVTYLSVFVKELE